LNNMQNQIIVIIILMCFFSCKNNPNKNINTNLSNSAINEISNIDDTNNNINEINNDIQEKTIYLSIALEGITDRIYLDGGDKETRIDYKMNTIDISCYDKTVSELQINAPFGWIYFNGSIRSKEETINLRPTQTQKANSNNVYYNDYFVFSAYEYTDIRFERHIFINTNNYIIIILIRILNSDVRVEMMRNNSQYFKILGGEIPLENPLEYNDGWLNDSQLWPCWDHGNGATGLFLEHLNNNANSLSNDIEILWMKETEEIISSIKLEWENSNWAQE